MIGITSFFLINFYYQRSVTFKSAFKAFSFNRISDISLLISLVIYLNITNSLIIDKSTFFVFLTNKSYYNFFFFKVDSLMVFLFFLTIASFIKSAQFGFHF